MKSYTQNHGQTDYYDTFTYDAAGNLTGQKHYGENDTQYTEMVYEYDNKIGVDNLIGLITIEGGDSPQLAFFTPHNVVRRIRRSPGATLTGITPILVRTSTMQKDIPLSVHSNTMRQQRPVCITLLTPASR